MATTDYDDRVFCVAVSGLRQQANLSTSHYTVKVSYRLLARTLQLIRHNGGTIVRIHAVSLAFPEQTPQAEQARSNRSNHYSATPGTLDAGAIAAQPSPSEAEAIVSEPSPLSKLFSVFLKKRH